MKRIITYGTFDLFHYGHLRLLKRAKELGDYLIVAVSTDEFNAIKGKKCIHPFEDRKRIVEAIKYVDEVIPETDWDQKVSDVKNYNIDIFTMGDDWKGKFDFLKEYCDVVYLPRTEGVSSSRIKLELPKKESPYRILKNKAKISISNASKKNLKLRKLLRKALISKRKLYYAKNYHLNKTDDKIILFEAYMGRSFACSPKAIYLELKNNEKYKDYTFVWAFTKPQNFIDLKDLQKTKIITYISKEYYKYLSKAKYIITNSRLPEHVKLREDQVYVQAWHGTPLKRLGYDIIVDTENALNTKEDMVFKYKTDAKRYSYMISPSKFTSDKYRSAFNLEENNPDCKIIEKGYPRNDFLYNFTSEDVEKIKKDLKLPTNKKVILYAPTWRDNEHTSGLGYTYNPEVNFDYLEEQLSKDYIILYRAHYFVANSFNFKRYSGFIYDVSEYNDINELYIVSDILITDYSSVFFDYANLNRPMIFFMYDLEYYKNNLRGFYISLEDLPGAIIKTEKEIVDIANNLKKYNKDNYSKYKEFNDKYNYLEDGKSSNRVIKEIFE